MYKTEVKLNITYTLNRRSMTHEQMSRCQVPLGVRLGRRVHLPEDDLAIRSTGDKCLLVTHQVNGGNAVGGGVGTPHDHGDHQGAIATSGRHFGLPIKKKIMKNS